eukprot:CAMPEP_0179032734 /NCGR_PEP_ID=MMETSP0796-20121207/11738_1 /TAXON_ID=73915 /ORGANISM="Pyrodinium bahamense, Strain pbaha01" /LENGTH=1995 /DNA_ID=CAMNT_0020728965 /DNA_START=22 /DNA_END=6009 /DNA_ORIENTATION=-
MAAASQRWKVIADGGIIVREAEQVSSRELRERLPQGAVIEELGLVGDSLHFRRISGIGPLTGWLGIGASHGKDTLVRVSPAKRKAISLPTEQSLAMQLAKRPSDKASQQLQMGTGGQWRVVSEEGLVVRRGQRMTSMKVPERLPPGVVVEEVEVVGNRLHFLNPSDMGPRSGWVSTMDKGQELLHRLAQPSDPATSFESIRKGFLSDSKVDLYPERLPESAFEKPLESWATLSRLYGRDVREIDPSLPIGTTVPAETMGRRRRVPREDLPPVDDLEHLDEGALMDLLGFDEVTAREFVGLSRAQKRKMIAEARALIEMGPEKRLEALENYRKAWPRGPFPELTSSVDEPNLLPPGSCFPYSRYLREVPSGPVPEWGLESPAGNATRTFFTRRFTSPPMAQKEFLRSLKCDISCTADAVMVEYSASQPDPCRVGGPVDKELLSGTIMAKGAVRPEDVLRYFNAELQRRVCLLDGRMGYRIEQEKLQEADYRGERFKNFKETDASGKTVSLKGNIEMLVLTKASIIGDIHKEYLLAGSDIVRTNTFGCNALTQKEYKMNKLVYEMNKAAAQLAKKAAAEVTKQEPKKPRFVAGVLGPTPSMMSLTPGLAWSEMVEAYDEQVKGLVDGGVDMLVLEGVTDSLNAKAAIFAIEEYFEKAKRRRAPLMVSAQITDSGRTLSGQSAEAFCISIKHAKPLVLGISCTQSSAQTKSHHKLLAALHLGWCSASPSAIGEDPEEFAAGILDCAKEEILNFVGGEAGVLPSHIAAVARRLEGLTRRRLPSLPDSPYLQLAGLDACLVKPEEGFKVVGSQCTVMGSAKFKKRISAYKATSKQRYLLEALEVCLEQCERGADILDFNLDSDMVNGPACPAKRAMSAFMQLASAEPRVAKIPFMLTSCEWDTIKEGLKRIQGKCIVNGITLTLGEEEFLRIAKECQRYGAALVILAITDDGEPAESYEDKVRICQRSYRLLRSRLDFPPEDIIFDCHVLLLGLPEFASRAANFISAVAELKRTCPCASFVGGLNNLSLAYRGLNMLRDALHSIFLYHVIPKGLNLAITWPGCLPIYSEIDVETRTLCEEMILNRSADANHLERFNAFVNFRSNSVACLPVQTPGLSKWTEDETGNWWKAPPVLKEAKETQKALVAQRNVVAPEEQKLFLQSLSCNLSCNVELLTPERGAVLPDPCRTEGTVNRQQLASTIVAKGGVRPEELAKYFNAELRKRVCVLATPDQEKMLGEADYKEYFIAGCDICGTNTLKSTSYDENKAAAQFAKSAAAEVTKNNSDKPRFVAGAIGPTSHALSSPSAQDPALRSSSWEELVLHYTEQIRGLVDGGVDLLVIEMASDTLNTKAAIYATEDYFEQSKKERLPLVITAIIADSGKMPSGQSIEAFLISVKHAKPLSVGVGGVLSKAHMKKASRALAELNLGWCHVSGSTVAGESKEALASALAEFADDKLVNFVSVCGVPAVHLTSVASKVKAASPRSLPQLPRTPALQLSGLDAYFVKQGDRFHMVGQRCNMGGSAKFKGLIDAYKYTKEGNRWEAAMEVCMEQYQAGADMLDFNFDSELTDSKWAMGKFMRLCSTQANIARVPFVLSSARWPVIEEGLRNVQGKSIVNAISLVQGEEEFLRMAKACQRYGAAVVIMTVDTPNEFPPFHEKVHIGQRAYKLLRTKLDFPPEDIIFDCIVPPVGGQESPKDVIDAVAELKRTCPLVSFIAGIGSLSLPYRRVPPLREALHSVFLRHAIPMGLNMAIVDPGALPRYNDIEAQTRKVCEEVVLNESADGSHLGRLESFGAFLSGGAAEEVPSALVPQYDVPMAITPPKRATPGFTQSLHTLVQGTGTINASLFQTFGSKCHTATIFHKNLSGNAMKRQVWFSSISAWMGQGGSGPVTACSSLMDCLALYERWQGFQNTGVSVEWGAIGEIGLRRTIYGSRDVFAQFDLGQKLIGPADTQFLMRAVCAGGPDPYEVVGMAYLDQTWQMTLAGVTSSGGLERKTFADM